MIYESQMMEDCSIHVKNITALLYQRKLIGIDDDKYISSQFEAQRQSGVVIIPLKESQKEQTSEVHINYLSDKLECPSLKQYQTPSQRSIVMLYIFPTQNKNANTVFERHLKQSDIAQLIVFGDEVRLKSLKKLTQKLQGEVKEHKRIDLIHFDTVLRNLFNTKHTVEYSVVSLDSLKSLVEQESINPMYMHKIAVNDPLLLYYGFDAYQVIKQVFISDITFTLQTQYMVTVPDFDKAQEMYSSSVIYTNIRMSD